MYAHAVYIAVHAVYIRVHTGTCTHCALFTRCLEEDRACLEKTKVFELSTDVLLVFLPRWVKAKVNDVCYATMEFLNMLLALCKSLYCQFLSQRGAIVLYFTVHL